MPQIKPDFLDIEHTIFIIALPHTFKLGVRYISDLRESSNMGNIPLHHQESCKRTLQSYMRNGAAFHFHLSVHHWQPVLQLLRSYPELVTYLRKRFIEDHVIATRCCHLTVHAAVQHDATAVQRQFGWGILKGWSFLRRKMLYDVYIEKVDLSFCYILRSDWLKTSTRIWHTSCSEKHRRSRIQKIADIASATNRNTYNQGNLFNRYHCDNCSLAKIVVSDTIYHFYPYLPTSIEIISSISCPCFRRSDIYIQPQASFLVNYVFLLTLILQKMHWSRSPDT